MNKIKTIALVAPCGNIKDFSILNENIKILEKKFKIKKYYSENPSNSLGYLSDIDEKRIIYLEKACLDCEVDLILNIRGGFGALRIVDKINYELIKNCGKYYASSSDGSILLASLSNKTNIKCYHCLMLANGFLDNLERNIEIIENNIFDIDLKPIYKATNKAKGRLWGGNLSSIVSMLSDEIYLPDDDIILFLEDLNEPMYKIDKMFYEIYRCAKLKEKIKAVIFGDFYFEEDEILPLLNEYAVKFAINCYLTKNITHKKNNITIPYNKIVEI